MQGSTRGYKQFSSRHSAHLAALQGVALDGAGEARRLKGAQQAQQAVCALALPLGPHARPAAAAVAASTAAAAAAAAGQACHT